MSTARDWSASVIAAGLRRGQVPRYGSPEWAKLPTADPRFVAAVAAAAEAWRDHCDSMTIRRDLELELIASRQLENQRQSTAFAELARTVRALSRVPTQSELCERRKNGHGDLHARQSE
jgi:hypothetical protein